MAEYSRSQMAQITSRIRKGNVSTFTAKSTKCLICGGQFLGAKCTHTVEENQRILGRILSSS